MFMLGYLLQGLAMVVNMVLTLYMWVIIINALGLSLSALYTLHIEPASVSLIEYWNGGATLRALNLRSGPW